MSQRNGNIPGAKLDASLLPEREAGAIPRELVDQFFDRELDEGSREKFFKMLRADLSRCAEVAKTQRLVAELREPVAAPDLTDAIMTRLHRKRAFLPPRLRRLVKASRLAAAACVLLGILGIALTQRYAPGALRLTPRPAPLSGVIQSGQAELADAVESIKSRTPTTTLQNRPESHDPQRLLVLDLKPGRTSVRVLPKTASDPSALALGGSGERPRFVLLNGVCIDRGTSTAMAFGPIWPPRILQDECSEGWKDAPVSDGAADEQPAAARGAAATGGR